MKTLTKKALVEHINGTKKSKDICGFRVDDHEEGRLSDMDCEIKWDGNIGIVSFEGKIIGALKTCAVRLSYYTLNR